MKNKFGAFGARQFSLETLVGGRPGTTIFQNPGGGGVAYKDRAWPPPRAPIRPTFWGSWTCERAVFRLSHRSTGETHITHRGAKWVPHGSPWVNRHFQCHRMTNPCPNTTWSPKTHQILLDNIRMLQGVGTTYPPPPPPPLAILGKLGLSASFRSKPREPPILKEPIRGNPPPPKKGTSEPIYRGPCNPQNARVAFLGWVDLTTSADAICPVTVGGWPLTDVRQDQPL